MRLPAGTPDVVRRAVTVYVYLGRVVRLAALAAIGCAALGALTLSYLIADRFVEWSVAGRATGPMLAIAAIIAILVAASRIVMARTRPHAAAVHLDKALPGNRDRWASALDLARRRAEGEYVGAEDLIDRLARETETETAAGPAARIVDRRGLYIALGVAAFVAAAYVFAATSGAFDLPLLWDRFWNPWADRARDSFTIVKIEDANGAGWHDADPSELPEGSVFSLSITLDRKTGWLCPAADTGEALRLTPPQLEILRSDRVESRAFVRRGRGWQVRIARLAHPIRFRVRAGDALSATHVQRVLSRVKLVDLLHTIRYPKYARLDDVQKQPLEGGRLSVLAGSRIEFHASYDGPCRSIEASFELLKKGGDGSPALPQDEMPNSAGAAAGMQPDQGAEPRRKLKVRTRGGNSGWFRLPVDDSGILRLHATGKDGLVSHEFACIIEAVADSPPMITLSGLETDTTIMPGETVAYQFRAEDDRAVSDIILDWTVAGGAQSEGLSGEEFLQSPHYGKQVVSGEELIQRMDYRVYATVPFEFRLHAVDSKGQETSTPTYRIHILDDSYAARLERGMEYLDLCRKAADAYRSYYQKLDNTLSIVSEAVGTNATWPSAQDQLQANYWKSATQLWHPFGTAQYYLHRYGGFPYRLDRSAVLLALPHLVLAGPGQMQSLAEQLRTTRDLPALLARLRALHARSGQLAEVWAAAVDAERARFRPDRVLNTVRVMQDRLASLAAIEGNRELHDANVRFYLDTLKDVLPDVRGLAASRPALGALADELTKACAQHDAKAVASRLSEFDKMLSDYRAPLSAEAEKLVSALASLAGDDEQTRERFRAARGEVMRARAQADVFLPFDILSQVPDAKTGSTTSDEWYDGAGAVGDLFFALDHLREDLAAHRIDILSGRHDLYPQRAADRDALLRERVIAIIDLSGRCADLDEDLKQRTASVLGAAASGKLSTLLTLPASGLERDIAELVRKIDAQTSLVADARAQGRDAGSFAASLEGVADRYDSHARECEEVASRPKQISAATTKREILRREATLLMSQVEGLEARLRATLFLLGQSRLLGEAPPSWDGWEPQHGLQLALTFAALRSMEQIAARHGKSLAQDAEIAANLQVIASSSREIASDLRAFARLGRSVLAGDEVQFDFDALMKRSKTIGHLEILKREFEFVSPFLGDAAPRAEQQTERLANSMLGKVALGEVLLSQLVRARSALASPSENASDLVRESLSDLSRSLRAAGSDELAAEADALRQAHSATRVAATKDAPQATRRRTSTFLKELDEAIDHAASSVRLPPVKATAQLNRRWTTSRGMPNLWTMQGIVDGFDRRWVELMGHTELCLVRELAARAFESVPSAPYGASLALQYGRMLELRARNLANEQRRNRGISFLAEEGGPSLKLPKHIAIEFIKARQKSAPEAFKNRIEEYYEQLLRDLSR